MAEAASPLIRSAAPADAEAVAAVLRRAFACYEGRLQPPAGALRESEETILAKLATEQALVAETPDGIAGCVFYRPADEPGAIYLGRLAVLPERQGSGIARRLMMRLEEAARAAGAAALLLNVRVALPENCALFERLGFHRIGDGRHPGHQEPTFTIMRKSLRR
jgi:predicted N-acetyltransferase YhbS